MTIWIEAVEETKPGYFQWWSVTEQESMDTEGFIWTVRVMEHWHRLHTLHPWIYLKAFWAWSWRTCSRWPCLKRAGQDDLQRSLSTSMIWWFWFCSSCISHSFWKASEILSLVCSHKSRAQSCVGMAELQFYTTHCTAGGVALGKLKNNLRTEVRCSVLLLS